LRLTNVTTVLCTNEASLEVNRILCSCAAVLLCCCGRLASALPMPTPHVLKHNCMHFSVLLRIREPRILADAVAASESGGRFGGGQAALKARQRKCASEHRHIAHHPLLLLRCQSCVAWLLVKIVWRHKMARCDAQC
jgi:hypothetical protein